MRLRVLSVTVRADLVWDDGNELTPGPVVEPVTLPLSALPQFAASIPSDVARLERDHLETLGGTNEDRS